MSTNSTDLSQLIAQRDELDRQINALRNEARTQALAQIRRIMTEFGLTAADLARDLATGRGRSASKTTGADGGSSPVKPKPKYRDENGNTWTGRGLQPLWLRAALEKNPEKTVENFLIKD